MRIVLPKDEAVAALQADNAILKRSIRSLEGKISTLQKKIDAQQAEKEKIETAKAFLRKLQNFIELEAHGMFDTVYGDGFF